MRAFSTYLLVATTFLLSRNFYADAGGQVNANKDTKIESMDAWENDEPRYWPRYSGTRRVRLLDGIWNTTRLEASSVFDSMDPNLNISKISTPEQVKIPSTVEVNADPEHGSFPGYMGYRGVSFFRTHFETSIPSNEHTGNQNLRQPNTNKGPGARIQFQACSFYCRVWLNGVEIGDHIAGGYVAWWLDVPDSVLQLGRKQQQRTQNQKQHPKEAKTRRTTLRNESTAATLVRQHELFVLVDNRFNSTTAPLHTGGDFWHYGGIMRSVEWHDRPKNETADKYSKHTKRILAESSLPSLSSLSNVWPWRLYVTPQKDLKSVKLALQIVGIPDSMTHASDNHILEELLQNGQIQIYFDGNQSANALDDFVLNRETAELSFVGRGSDRWLEMGPIPVPHPRIWSTTDLQLHTVSVNLNGAIVTERFGLRFWDITTTTAASDGDKQIRETMDAQTTRDTIASNSSRIRLNGKVLKLLGWNHHTQWPYTAASPTDQQLDEDIRLLKEQGHANFVRGAHYPQDPRWLDRLDENGLVVWCGKLRIVFDRRCGLHALKK